MPDRSRALPERPNLRYLRLEAKRRLAAGEFATLHDAQTAIARDHGQPSWAALKHLVQDGPVVQQEDGQQEDGPALTQIRWVISRFSGAGQPGWAAPGEDELRQHFSASFLTALPPARLIEVIGKLAADLRGDPVIIGQGPLEAQVELNGMRYLAAVEAEPPYRLIGLRGLPTGSRLRDPRTAPPVPQRTRGDVPAGVPAVADQAFAELGLPALLLAGGAVLGQLIADVTGLPYAEAAARLVLGPLGLRDSSFPASRTDVGPGAVTSYHLTREGRFEPTPAMIPTIPAAGGLWSTGADLVRLGLGWSSLLPGSLAHEALTPQAEPPPGPGQRPAGGLGWLISPRGDMAAHAGGGLDGTAILAIRIRDNRTHLVLTSRLIPVNSIDSALRGVWTNPEE